MYLESSLSRLGVGQCICNLASSTPVYRTGKVFFAKCSLLHVSFGSGRQIGSVRVALDLWNCKPCKWVFTCPFLGPLWGDIQSLYVTMQGANFRPGEESILPHISKGPQGLRSLQVRSNLTLYHVYCPCEHCLRSMGVCYSLVRFLYLIILPMCSQAFCANQ